MALEDLHARDDHDLYGAIVELWHMISSYTDLHSKVKVFNPHQKKNGWQSKHTVIQVVHQDMPFVVDSIELILKRYDATVHLICNMPLSIVRIKKVRSPRSITLVHYTTHHITYRFYTLK